MVEPRRPEPAVHVLLEGRSDAAAVGAAAEALGLDLDGVRLVSMEGVTNLSRHLAEAREAGTQVRGLYDGAEEDVVVRALRRAGFDAHAGGTEGCGFYRCDRDLEDELVRAAGTPLLQEVLEETGLARAFETLTHQPDWRDRPFAEQVHRFAGAGSGRKEVLARAVTTALGPGRLPAPIAALLRSLPGRRPLGRRRRSPCGIVQADAQWEERRPPP